ncbi:dienelactone hydrolase family protein-like protein [Polychaeton citri CBS 116435]|uniref:Dienelactone hydrolase family protein-like protein n=1 Tax=Polychaeton citri CBS 116435 TaxID=1314669 RepID=A0A9P4Q6B6_9PEZI|nr:dienelactone hydrolase family protein-like protein [Polychaeton citri CBS 116435]
MATHSKACCSLPVAQAEGYSAKGTYETLGDVKYYTIGPATAKKAIFFIYDIFGYTPQTIQGADILARGQSEYLVVMPDLFEGKPAQAAWFADKEAHQDELGAFLSKLADPSPKIAQIHSFFAEASKKYPSVEKWGTIGYCFGGKLVALTSGDKTPWAAAIQTSPAYVSAADAEKVTVPMALLASQDEPADAVKDFDAALNVPKHIETFEGQIHGWMSARANLKDDVVRKEYERGYQVALTFFGEHL